jgi:hypothetical protein
MIVGASENDSAPPSGTRRGPISKARTITVKLAWREARKSLQRGPRPTKRRRRTEEEFAAAKKIKIRRRPVGVPAAEAAAALYLSDTLDWLNLWQDNAISGESDCQYAARGPLLAPHL